MQLGKFSGKESRLYSMAQLMHCLDVVAQIGRRQFIWWMMPIWREQLIYWIKIVFCGGHSVIPTCGTASVKRRASEDLSQGGSSKKIRVKERAAMSESNWETKRQVSLIVIKINRNSPKQWK
jgi:hypothetical protein